MNKQLLVNLMLAVIIAMVGTFVVYVMTGSWMWSSATYSLGGSVVMLFFVWLTYLDDEK